ncbi:MAG: hypothetical protein ACXW3C_00265 [Pyrinomonadaceae bacterium]
MNTNSPKTNCKIWLGAATGFALILLAASPRTALAQQWTTNGNNINNTNTGNVGVGTTSPEARLSVHDSYGNVAIFNSTNANGIYTTYRNSGTDLGYIGSQKELVSGGTLSDFGIMVAGATSKLVLGTNSNSRLTIDGSGNIGIGTTSPIDRLHVKYPAGTNALPTYESSDRSVLALGLFQTQTTARDYGAYFLVAPNTADFKLVRRTNNSDTDVMTVLNANGNIGIGTTAPTVKLDVNGNTKITGNIEVTGTINAKYQDVAEWVPATRTLPAGTVVVLNPTQSNQVMASAQAYDTRVAGVISEKPGITLGEASIDKVLVATTGRVLVKVDATRAPIHVGDLLVTSDTPGLAMRSEPIKVGGRLIHMPGTLIGKALEPLEKGSGKILVLLSLQ